MRARPIDGLLLVDKPAGMTSHDVVLIARRASGERRIGHAGTLDPFATGLLVLLLGRATRLLPYVQGEPKVYRATIAFGSETDTEDAGGQVTRVAAPPSEGEVLDALPALTGDVMQMPPQYSAKRVDGRRAYAAARAGEHVELRPVRIRVDSWQLLGWSGARLEARVSCGAGTYVRSLARDLGRLSGSAAHLSALRRERSGPFRVEEASTVAALREAQPPIRPALDALGGMPRQRLDEDEVGRIVRGIDIAATVPGDFGALTHPGSDALVSVAERRGDRWQPRVVMREA